MSNLTISVDDELIKRAKVRAIQQGTSLSAKVREFLAAYANGGDAPARPAPAPLPVSRAQGGLLPGIDPRSNHALLEASMDEAPHP
ncbi:MAG: DUF6364 family protein [Rhodoferax sp.]